MSTLARFMWGWAVTSSNNKLDFVDNGSTFAATLNEGDYLPAEFAAEVQRAMREANTDNDNNTCTFSFSTRKFTLGGTATFSLLWNSGANTANTCAGLLGFDESADDTGATSYTGDGAVGATHSDANAWEPTDPVVMTTPVTAAADGTTATRLQRRASIDVVIADSGLRKYVYRRTDKFIRLQFRWLGSSEQTNMESLLDWIERGRRVNYQPDKTSTNALRLALAEPGEVSNAFSHLASTEVDYPELVFVQQLSRT